MKYQTFNQTVQAWIVGILQVPTSWTIRCWYDDSSTAVSWRTSAASRWRATGPRHFTLYCPPPLSAKIPITASFSFRQALVGYLSKSWNVPAPVYLFIWRIKYKIPNRLHYSINVNWTILSSKPLKLITIKTFLASGIFEYLIYHP